MSGKSRIEWTDETWNPVTGCTKVSPGCKYCYAERSATRMRSRFGYPEDEPFRVTLHPDRLEQPLHWRKPRRVFVCSMSDLFHEEVPFEYIDRVFGGMSATRRHTYQILTKRPMRMRQWTREWHYDEWVLPNVWLGVTVENQEQEWRIAELLHIPAAVRFVSVEPMLGSVDLAYWVNPVSTRTEHHPSCDGTCRHGLCPIQVQVQDGPRIDWVIIGCESGGQRRPLPIWRVRQLARQCRTNMIPVFIKQLDVNGHVSRDPDEWSEDLRIQEFPRS